MIKPFKDYLFNALTAINGNVIPGTTRPQDGNTYPCVTYSLPTSSQEENREDFILEINIWGNKPDCEEIDNITDSIEAKLKKVRYLDENQFLIFQKLNRFELTDTEEYIRRRMLRYLIKREER